MGKKRKMKMSAEKLDKITELAQKMEIQMRSMDINPDDELEVFAEAVALTVLHWGRTGNWSLLETISYAGYVIMGFMEKGVGAEIDSLETFIKKRQVMGTN